MSALTDILRFHNKTVSEDFLFGMGCGLQIRIANKVNNSWTIPDNNVPNWIECGDIFLDWFKISEVINSYGFDIKCEKSNSIDELFKFVIEDLKNGMPTIIVSNIFYLDYYPMQAKSHNGHTLVVNGIDVDSNEVWVADNNITTLKRSIYQGKVSIDNLKKSMDLSEVGMNSPSVIFRVIRKERCSYIQNADIASEIEIRAQICWQTMIILGDIMVFRQ
jgi:hypothetical protein